MQGNSERQETPRTPALRTGLALIPGNTFTAKSLVYVIEDGMAMFEGDIILGTVEEVDQETERLRDEMSGLAPSSVVIAGDLFRWPNGIIHYTVDSTLPDQARVTDAIAHWQSKTKYRFVQRTGEANYVTFRRTASGCSAHVGMRGGQQFVNVGPACTTGNIIHEIGHTVGLWHEQSREDRDLFVTINFANVIPGRESEFAQHIADGDDVGPYDYGSIMHYSRTAFSKDGVSETIIPKEASAAIGQRTALSAGDIAAANSLVGSSGPAPALVPPYPGRLLKFPPMTQGPDVSLWQQKIVDRGFPLAVDGKYGPKSKEACIKFQKQKGLQPDGIVGPITWQATFGP